MKQGPALLGQRHAGPAGRSNVRTAGPLPVSTVLPFVAMLLALAICSLQVAHWSEPNRPEFSVWASPGRPSLVRCPFRGPRGLVGPAEAYVAFILLPPSWT